MKIRTFPTLSQSVAFLLLVAFLLVPFQSFAQGVPEDAEAHTATSTEAAPSDEDTKETTDVSSSVSLGQESAGEETESTTEGVIEEITPEEVATTTQVTTEEEVTTPTEDGIEEIATSTPTSTPEITIVEASAITPTTAVNGDITEDTTWTATGSPYVVDSDVRIRSGITLTIEPGTVVKFEDNARMRVEGILSAEGTEGEKIYFTSIKDDAVGGDTNGDGVVTSPTAEDWQRIAIFSNGTAQLVHVVVRYGGKNVSNCYGSGTFCAGSISNNGMLTLTNAEINHNGDVGIGHQSSTSTISSSRITGHETNVFIRDVRNGESVGKAEILDSVIDDAISIGIAVGGSGTDTELSLHNNTFFNNARDVQMGWTKLFEHSGNTSIGGTGRGFYMSSDLLGNTVWTKDDMPYVIDSDLRVRSGVTLTIKPGAVIKFTNDARLRMEGVFEAEGTIGDKIHFTSIKDDTVGGDTEGDGDATVPAAEDWRQIQVWPGAHATLDHIVVRYGGESSGNCFGFGTRCAGGVFNRGTLMLRNAEIMHNGARGVDHKSGTSTISGTEITGHDYGVFIENGSLEISQSSLASNTFCGLFNNSGTEINAKNNWWEDALGPFHPTLNATTTGVTVSDNVDFDPWLTSDPFAIDPLILQYEPILYLHENENYKPMNVEAFVEASALWDDNDLLPDTLIKSRGTVTVDDIGVGGSEDWYLAFSGDEAKAFDPAVAKTRYDQLVTGEDAKLTYYAHKTTDSYMDGDGVTREFIVLQYWYFYAFNDWAVHGGFNNHEGDWESVMVFLDKNTEEPMYVAYSAHHNDGDPSFNFTQYDSVRRDWEDNEVEKENVNQIISYVALGSHANYPNNGNDGVHNARSANDQTSAGGDHIETNDWLIREIIDEGEPAWMSYEGKWGADTTLIGGDGPRGPNFLDVTGNIRFQDPITWAGIDQITEKTVGAPENEFSFPKQLIDMLFEEALAVGEVILVDLHDEVVSFGENISALTLLPHFWDLGVSLENGTFNVDVALRYDQTEIDALEINEDDLVVHFYNEETNTWEEIDSFLDTVADTLSFNTDHFSRYAIGVAQEEPTEEIYDRLYNTIKDSTLSKKRKHILRKYLEWAEYIGNKDGKKAKKFSILLLKIIDRKVEWYERRGQIDTESAEKIYEDIDELVKKLEEDINN